MNRSISRPVILMLLLVWSAGSFSQDCSDFSHIKAIAELDTRIEYQQIGCEGFQKTFTRISSGEKFIEEYIPFSREWMIEEIDNEAEYRIKKIRIFWSNDRQKLIEEYYIDGYKKIVAKLKSFYRFRNETYSMDKKHVSKQGQNFHRYVYKDGRIEEENQPTHKKYPRLQPDLFNQL